MRRAHAIADDIDNARVDRPLECVHSRHGHRLCSTEVGAQCDGHQQPSHLGSERGDAHAEQILDPTGQRDVLATLGNALLDERPPELDHEQRVAKRHIDHPPQQFPGEAQIETRGKQAPRRTEAQRSHVQPTRRAALERPLEQRRCHRPLREQERNRLTLKPPCRECEHVARRAIQPLQVVDRDEQRPVRAEHPQDAKEAERDRLRPRRPPTRLGAQQRDFERRTLRWRQHRQRVLLNPVAEVDQPGERMSRFGATRACDEHVQALVTRALDPLLP